MVQCPNVSKCKTGTCARMIEDNREQKTVHHNVQQSTRTDIGRVQNTNIGSGQWVQQRVGLFGVRVKSKRKKKRKAEEAKESKQRPSEKHGLRRLNVIRPLLKSFEMAKYEATLSSLHNQALSLSYSSNVLIPQFLKERRRLIATPTRIFTFMSSPTNRSLKKFLYKVSNSSTDFLVSVAT